MIDTPFLNQTKTLQNQQSAAAKQPVQRLLFVGAIPAAIEETLSNIGYGTITIEDTEEVKRIFAEYCP